MIRVIFCCLCVFVYSRAEADDSLRKKLGQMILVGFIGPEVPDSLYIDLSTRNLGGVILSGANGNLTSPYQIQQLTGQIRSDAQSPPFIAVDQEGGAVARLNGSNGFASTYTEYVLGTVFASLDSTRKQAALMTSWLSACGININFAPVVDVNVNPSSPAIGYYGRSFSADPMTVAAHAKVFIDQSHAANIMTTLKHFPGHGSARTDSHFTLPDITNTWTSGELIPYRELLTTNSVDVVMVGHLYNAHIDSVYPTSLSYPTIHGLLRDSLGYDGVVITDDLYNMAAITQYFGFWDAAEHAINAGADILLYVSNTLNNASLARQLIDSLESKVQRGLIAESRIDEAYTRITRLKNRYFVTGVAQPLASARNVPQEFELSNYPNPFNPTTTIRYGLPFQSRVNLAVFNTLGQQVAVLQNGEQDAGYHEVRFDAVGLSSGVYFYRLQAETYVQTRKLLLLK